MSRTLGNVHVLSSSVLSLWHSSVWAESSYPHKSRIQRNSMWLILTAFSLSDLADSGTWYDANADADRGAPVGVQIVCKRYEEGKVLAIAKSIDDLWYNEV